MKPIRSMAIAVMFFATVAVSGLSGMPASAQDITVHKTPWCGCCTGWVKHLEENGFSVTAVDHEDLAPIKSQLGVPRRLQSCHTAVVDGYVVEGHVPAEEIHKMLAERPAIKGLAVPGMPIGSPGMEGADPEPYTVYSFDAKGKAKAYAAY